MEGQLGDDDQTSVVLPIAAFPFRFPFPCAFRATLLVDAFLSASSMVLRFARDCTAFSLSSVVKALRSPLFTWICEIIYSRGPLLVVTNAFSSRIFISVLGPCLPQCVHTKGVAAPTRANAMTTGVARHGAALVFRPGPHPSHQSRRPLDPALMPSIPRGEAAWPLDPPSQPGAALFSCLALSGPFSSCPESAPH